MKEELLKTSQAASVYFGPAANNPLPSMGGRVPGKNINTKKGTNLGAENFA